MDTVRVLRFIEYIGPRDKVEKQILNSMKDGTHSHGNGVIIHIGTVGDFPHILDTGTEEPTKDKEAAHGA